MKRLFSTLLLLIPLTLIAGDGAVVLSEKVDISVDAQGQVTRHVQQRIQLNTFRTIRSMGEWFHVYNPELEALEIIRSVTVQPDGTTVSMPENAMLDQTPYAVQHAPDFSGIRERMVSRTGLEPGCIVEFEYKTRDLVPHRMLVREPMGGYFPVREKQVTIHTAGIGATMVNGAVESDSDGTYTVHNQPAILDDYRFSTPLNAPFILLTLDPVKDTLTERLAVSSPMDTAIETMGLGTQETDARVVVALKHLLSERLDTISLSPELLAGPRTIDQIVGSGYATAFEKVRIAHGILQHYAVPHQILMLDHVMDGNPLLTDPAFLVVSDSLIWPGVADLENRSVIALWGTNAEPAGSRQLTVSAHLTQQGTAFAGKIVMESRAPFYHPSILSVLPLSGMKGENTACTTRTMDLVLETADVTWEPDENRINVQPVIPDYLHLADLASTALWATDLSVSDPVHVVVDVTLQFESTPAIVMPGAVNIENTLGKTTTIWALGGNTLRIRMSADWDAFHVRPGQFKPLMDLITPLLSATRQVGFIQ